MNAENKYAGTQTEKNLGDAYETFSKTAEEEGFDETARRFRPVAANNFDTKALYRISYGLYVLTTKDENKDNGCIVNTVMQVTSNPTLVAVTVNKQNYTCEIIQKTGILNINSLSEDTPFEIFRHFGYQSGRNTDKFAGGSSERSENGLIVLARHATGFISLSVQNEIDLGTHIMFLCAPTEGKVFSEEETLSYSYYQKYIKPAPAQSEKKKGFVCEICGHIFEGDALPDDYICPICKHGAEAFHPL